MPDFNDTAFASGAIASFNNGADDVPMSSVIAHIAPTLTGKNAVNMKQAKKNLLPIIVDYPNFESKKNSMTCTLLPNGKLKFNGTTTASTDFTFYPASAPNAPHLYVPNGEYTFSNIGSNDVKMVVSGGNNNGFPYREIVNTSYTGNVTDDTKPFNYVVFRIASGVTLSNVVIEPMLEVGSSASSYEAYNAPTTYTAQLGRTIYGGQADIVSGQGIDNCTRIQIKDRTWEITTVGNFQVFTCNKITTKEANFNFVVEGYENAETYRNYLADKQCGTYNITNAMDRICIRDDLYLTVEAFTEAMGDNYIVYENTSPTLFTFDGQEIPSLLGVNNLWADTGTMNVEYYKSGYGTTSVTIHKETPDGEPVEETRKLHRIIYEGQVDVISGTGLIYRGESGTQYDPPEQISFTPIEVSTDEGENTLYADEGDSAITYRKAVE